MWGRIIVCACITLAFFHPTGIASAQSAELAGVSTLIQQGKLEEAEKRLHHYLLKLPHSAKANNLLGAVYLRQKIVGFGRVRQLTIFWEQSISANDNNLLAEIDCSQK